jgi:hypothetical protein
MHDDFARTGPGHDQAAPHQPARWRLVVGRASLVLLGAAALYQGVWAQMAPQSFFVSFPGGMSWVAREGPFNEHLTRDVGGLVNGLAVVALLAAWTVSSALTTANAIGWLVYAVPHFAYHVTHPLEDSHMQILNVGVLTGEIALPLLGLLAVLGRRQWGSAYPGRHSAAADVEPQVSGGVR